MFLLALVLLWGLLLHGSIFSDVAGFFTGGIKNIRDLIGKVWGAIKHVINWAARIFGNVGSAWGELHSAITVLISGLEHVAEGSYSALRFLTNTLVPKWARKAISDAISWAERNIKNVANNALKLAKGVKTWAFHLVTSVERTLQKALRVVRSSVNTVIHWIAHSGKWLWDTVHHPKKLVTWILPSLVTPLFRFILQHLESLALLIGRWIFSNLGKFIEIIERVIVKIL